MGRSEAGQVGEPSADEQAKADRERRIIESFAKAGEQLGSDKRKAQESGREYWPIMETLTAYVREHAPWSPRQALANLFRSTPRH